MEEFLNQVSGGAPERDGLLVELRTCVVRKAKKKLADPRNRSTLDRKGRSLGFAVRNGKEELNWREFLAQQWGRECCAVMRAKADCQGEQRRTRSGDDEGETKYESDSRQAVVVTTAGSKARAGNRMCLFSCASRHELQSLEWQWLEPARSTRIPERESSQADAADDGEQKAPADSTLLPQAVFLDTKRLDRCFRNCLVWAASATLLDEPRCVFCVAFAASIVFSPRAFPSTDSGSFDDGFELERLTRKRSCCVQGVAEKVGAK